MITPETLDAAIFEAQRFLRAAKKITFKELPKNEYRRAPYNIVDSPAPVNAAAKRASMDLTRALAQLRKP